MRSITAVWTAAACASTGALAGDAVPRLAVLAAGVAGCVLLATRRTRVAIGALSLVAFAAGALGEARTIPARSPPPAGGCVFSGRIVEHAGALGTLVVLEHVSCPSSEPPADLLVIADGDIGDAGGTVAGSGTLMPLDDDGFGRARRRVGAETELVAEGLETAAPVELLPALAARVRAGSRRAASGLPWDEGALLRGLTIGDTSDMSEIVDERFRNAGLSHLVAVSGSNVAIVLGAVALTVRRWGVYARIAVGFLSLSVFVLVVGPDPSVLRATVMGGVGLLAVALGRRAEPLHALGIAVALLAVFRPSLLTAAGFHLSLAATAGIVVFTEPISARLTTIPELLARPLGATLAAQLAVAPVLLGTFGELSLIAPIANLLVIPAVAPATILGYGAAVAGAVHGPLGGLIAKLAEPFLSWILFVAELGDVTGASAAWPRWTAIAASIPVVGAAIASLRAVARGA